MNISILSVFVVVTLLGHICSAAVNPSSEDLFQNDNNVLRLALTVENLDTPYYAQHLDPTVNSSAFTQQQFLSAGYDANVYQLFLVLLANERAHVALLQATLLERNGTTVPPCSYNFPNTTTVNDFVFWSKVFENVGTAAYDGSIGAIYNKTLQTSAATIATVEARHAAFLNTLNVTIPPGATLPPGVNITFPYPYAIDLAFSSQTVNDLISPFIISCPYYLPVNPIISVIIPVAAPGASPSNPSEYQVRANDANAVNFALALALLQATFYNRYLDDAAYDVNAFTSAGYTAVQRAYIDVVRAHKNSHIITLRQVVTSLGFTPTTNCTYNFPVTNVTSFLTTAALLENTGVSAYDGSVNTINDPTTRQTAAQIATVEARHAAYVNQLTDDVPYSVATDVAIPPASIAALITANQSANGLPLVTGCDLPTLPQVLLINPYSNTTTSTSTSTSTSSTTAKSTSTSTSGTGTSTGGTTSGSAGAASVSASVLLFCLLLAVVMM